MTDVPEVIPISAIEHYGYCPRQCALIHVDGMWSDNVHTVRGAIGHRRVDDLRQSRSERGRVRDNRKVALRVEAWGGARPVTRP
ncbi:MAG: Dna2/Cas4 domain-containing protein [Actinomycetota bacterium]|nr:Dna2/Cas4 domain-containing protein [Actinomycetota bacterium]MDA8076739.1 Dna2/Cas4 domain-containing protein [Actinomycetota bacterium]